MKTVLQMFVPLLCLSACVGVNDQSSHSLTPILKVPEAASTPVAGAEGAATSTAEVAAAMPRGNPVAAPQQYETYCAANPADCVIPDTPAVESAIRKGGRQVHKMITPTEERVDVWTALDKPGTGDCEDFALTLRKQLRARFPGYAGAFRIATAYTETGAYHAVLTVETNRGTIVCDIRYDACASWQSFPYKWRLREIPGSHKWQQLGPYQVTPEELETKGSIVNTASAAPMTDTAATAPAHAPAVPAMETETPAQSENTPVLEPTF